MTDKIKAFWNDNKLYPNYFRGNSDNNNFGFSSTCKEEILKKVYGKRGTMNGKFYLVVHTKSLENAMAVFENKNFKVNFEVAAKSAVAQLLRLDVKKDFKYPAQLDLFLTSLNRSHLNNSSYKDWQTYFSFMFDNVKNLHKIPYSLISPPNSVAHERGMYEVLRSRPRELEAVLKN